LPHACWRLAVRALGPNDAAVFRYSYPASFVGQTIYVKVPAFNVFGQQLQSLAALAA